MPCYHVVRVIELVAFFKLLIHKWVVNACNRHIVEQVSFVFVLARVRCLVVKVLHIHLHASVRLLEGVVEEERVLRAQILPLGEGSGVPSAVHVVEPGRRCDRAILANPLGVEVHRLQLEQLVARESASKHHLY